MGGPPARPPLLPPSQSRFVDPSLHAIGFEYDTITSEKVSGRFKVTLNCCQALEMLHGGVSAMVAEGLASVGAFQAAGKQRVAGVQLSINHLKSAKLGETVYAEATPITVGKTIQVWEARLWKCDPSNAADDKNLIASSRVTVVTNLPLPKSSMNAHERVSKL